MAHIISFRTDKFDVSSEEPNPINPIAGQSVSAWLKAFLADTDWTLSEPDAEDWGWYMYVDSGGQSYLVGASADADSRDVVVAWVVQVHKNRSLMDKLFGRNRLAGDDPVFRRLESIITSESSIRDVTVEMES